MKQAICTSSICSFRLNPSTDQSVYPSFSCMAVGVSPTSPLGISCCVAVPTSWPMAKPPFRSKASSACGAGSGDVARRCAP